MHSTASLSGSVSRSRKTATHVGMSHKTSGGAAAAATAVNPLDPSSLDVANIGWGMLEPRYQELKAMLSAPTSGLNAKEARVTQRQQVSAALGTLLDQAQRECRRLLIEGHAKMAIDGGLLTLRLKEDFYGSGSLQLVPVYFHLARTNQYLDRFKSAEEFLSLAQWVILRSPDEADVSLKAELHQTFGLLYASDSKLDAALKQLTCAAYYLSQMNGPEHILTSFGYFDIGNVFAARANMENAMAFYDKVKEIWYRHLRQVLDERQGEGEVSTPYATPTQLGEENMQDAVKMLRGIVGLQTERFSVVHPSVCRSELVLGLFFLFNYDAVTAQTYLLKALEIAKRVYGPRHHLTVEIRTIIESNGLQVPEDTAFVLDSGSNGSTPGHQQQQQHQEPPAGSPGDE